MNTEKIVDVSLFLLGLPVIINKDIPFIAHHPFTNTTIVFDGKEMLDLTKEGNEEIWKTKMKDVLLKKDSNFASIYCMLNKPYRLLFLKECKPFMTKEEFAEWFADAWTDTEYPNQDANITKRDFIKWYKEAPKYYLMEEDEYNVYKNLPDMVTCYRGVKGEKYEKGLSWTLSCEKAEWFANRFVKDGYVLKTVVPKEMVLAYFNRRGEDEIILDIFSKKEWAYIRI